MRCSRAHTAPGGTETKGRGGCGGQGWRTHQEEKGTEKHRTQVDRQGGLLGPALPSSLYSPMSPLLGPARLRQPLQPPHVRPAPRVPATRTLVPGSAAFLGSPGLPVEDDWECRLWEETTIFIVWIKYCSWPSCCLLSVLFFPLLRFLSFLPLLPSISPPSPFLPRRSSTPTIQEEAETLGARRAVSGCQAVHQAFPVPTPRRLSTEGSPRGVGVHPGS